MCGKAQNERESELVMGMQSVTRKAALLNEYLDRYGDPLGYQIEIQRIFAVTAEDVRRVARQYLGPHFVELDVIAGDPASRAGRGGRGRCVAAPLVNPPIVEIRDESDRAQMPVLGPTPGMRPQLQLPAAFEWP